MKIGSSTVAYWIDPTLVVIAVILSLRHIAVYVVGISEIISKKLISKCHKYQGM